METALRQNWPTASQLVKKYYKRKEDGRKDYKHKRETGENGI